MLYRSRIFSKDNIIERQKGTERIIIRRLSISNMDERGCFLWPKPRNHKLLLNARLCRLTETARLLKNVKSVFTRRSNAASRVNVEVELSRKLSFPQTHSYTPGIFLFITISSSLSYVFPSIVYFFPIILCTSRTTSFLLGVNFTTILIHIFPRTLLST